MGTPRLKFVSTPIWLIVWLLIITTTASAIPLKKVKDALEKPAYVLAEQSKQVEIVETARPISQPDRNQIENTSWPWWYWAIGAAVVGILVSSLSNSSTNDGGSGSSGSSCPTGEGTCGSTTFTW